VSFIAPRLLRAPVGDCYLHGWHVHWLFFFFCELVLEEQINQLTALCLCSNVKILIKINCPHSLPWRENENRNFEFITRKSSLGHHKSSHAANHNNTIDSNKVAKATHAWRLRRTCASLILTPIVFDFSGLSIRSGFLTSANTQSTFGTDTLQSSHGRRL
jgi:hypothetical protein